MRRFLQLPRQSHADAHTPSGLAAGVLPAFTFRRPVAGLSALCCLLALLLLTSYTASGQGPCPSGNCTSSDLTVTKVELVKADGSAMPNICPSDGSPIAVALKVTFDVTSNTRYGFIIIGDVYINGTNEGKVWQCFGNAYSQGLHTEIVTHPNLLWPCGSTIELRNVFTAWDNTAPATPGAFCNNLNPDGTLNNCSAIDPKCKYYGSTTSFTVAAPLVASFTIGGTCSNNTLYKPINLTGSTTGGNAPYQYSWQVTDVVTNTVVGTGTGITYSYTPQTAHNLSVQLTVTDGSTPTTATSTAVQAVTVETCCTPPTISAGPSAQNICAGGNASFSVAYSGGLPEPVVRWEVSTNGTSWTPLAESALYSHTASSTLNITGATAGMNGYQYRAVLQSGVCAEVTSGAALLGVSPATVGGRAGSAQTVCTGSAPASSLTLSGQVGDVVRWQRSTDGFVSNSTDISSTSLTLTPAEVGALTADTWFRAVVKSGACPQAYSEAVKITVSPATVGGRVSAPQRLCTGSPLVSSLVLDGQVGTVVKWQRSSSANFTTGVSDISETSLILGAGKVGPLTADTWFRAVVKSGACPQAYSEAVKITVDANSVGGSVGSAQTVCSGSRLKEALALTGQLGTVVKWQRSTDNFNQDITDIEETTATLSPEKVGTLAQNTWFRAVVKNGECFSVESGTVLITVQQPISNNTVAAPQTICSATIPNALTGTLPIGGDGAYVYQWQSRTTGDFVSVYGATGKDYAPGALGQTTQFRRIVTAGSACAVNTSAAVTITISAESEVYPLAGSNYCATAATRGTVTLGGSYPGVSYQLIRASDHTAVQDPKTGTGAVLTWLDVPGGEYYVKGTGVAPTNCTSQTATVAVHEFDCSVFYTLTQGYYGSKQGKSCIGYTPVNTIMELLREGELKVGGSTKWLKVPATEAGASKLNSILPGGQSPNGLVNGTACYITATSPDCLTKANYLTKQGRLNNVLLAQTFTLGLNTRWKDGELLLFPIRSGYLTTQAMTGCQDGAVVVETCTENTVSSILMNEKVVRYLGTGATVADLLQLANEVLGGDKVAGKDGVPSYSDINEAVDAINKSFDEGRRFLDYYAGPKTCSELFPDAVVLEPVYVTAAAAPAAPLREQAFPAGLSVRAYPNPYTDRVRFAVENPQAGKGSLELFNPLGQKVVTVYEGFIPAGRQQWEMRLSQQQQSSSLIYVLTIDGKRVTGKLFRLSR